MKSTVLFASFTFPFVYSRTSGELCRGTGEQAPDGNWYCSEVRAITYRNISQSGVYNRTTSIDPSTGICGHETVKYGATGPLTPLFGEVHYPGTIHLAILTEDIGFDASARSDERLPACCVPASGRHACFTKAEHCTILRSSSNTAQT
jgi:hypothetical protein